MKFDLIKASKRLSELELHIKSDNLVMDVLWFRAMVLEGEWNIPRHTHSTYEFHFIFSGSCIVVLDGEEFVVNAGEFYLTAPSVYHEQKSSGLERFVEYSINCDLKLAEDIPSEAEHILSVLAKSPCRPVKDSTGIMKLFNKALDEAYRRNLGFLNNIKSLALMIVINSARAISGNIPARYDFPHKPGKNDYRLRQIHGFIEDNITGSITTGDISKHMFLSEKQVSRIIKQSMGVSTKEYVLRKKLDRAKELLKSTDLSIKQIAELLGFSSEYYFNQFFKREEGFPPGVFRKNTQNV